MKRVARLILALTVMILTGEAQAQGLVEKLTIQLCTVVADDAKRLECYDSIVKSWAADRAKTSKSDAPIAPAGTPALPEITAQPEGVSVSAGWAIDERNKADGTPQVVVSAVASPSLGNLFSDAGPSTLLLRCTGGVTSLFIVFDKINATASSGPTVPVEHRIDSRNTTTIRLWISGDRRAIGTQGPPAIALIKKMLPGKEVNFYIPLKGWPSSEFDLSGLTKAVAPLRKVCGW